MSLSDTAEYWQDVKKGYDYSKKVFTHAKGCVCGHFHVCETNYISEIDCYACKKVFDEMGNIFGLKERRLSKQEQIEKYNPVLFKYGIKVGDSVRHEDYEGEIFIVSKVDQKEEVVETLGGKNGIWINHASLITKVNIKKKKR